MKKALGSANTLPFFLDKVKKERYDVYITIGGYSMESEKKEVLLRLRRIEGQIRGLQRMVDEGVPCAERPDPGGGGHGRDEKSGDGRCQNVYGRMSG